MLKVIFHVDELEKWAMTKGNIQNFILATQDEEVEVELLVNGPAVNHFVDLSDDDKREVENLIKNDVKVKLCRNALNSNNIDPNILMDELIVVQAGVVELAKRQRDGFAYIRP